MPNLDLEAWRAGGGIILGSLQSSRRSFSSLCLHLHRVAFMCCQLENRQQEELAELQQRLDKEMQALHASLARELDADAQQQVKERERSQKSAVASEAKRRKHIQQLHEMELKQLHQQQKREYQKNKEEIRKVIYQIAVIC